MAVQYNPAIVTDGLLNCYDLLNLKSYSTPSTAIKDCSGITLANLSLINGATAEFPSGSISLDGVNDYGFLPNYFYTSWSQQMTLDSWVYIPSDATWSNGNRANIISNTFYGCAPSLCKETTNNRVGAIIRIPVAGATHVTTGNITRDRWYQLCCTWSGSVLALYIDGAFASSVNATLTGSPPADGWGIGRSLAFGGNYDAWYKGKIGPIKFYSKALNASEVLQNFNALRGRFGI